MATGAPALIIAHWTGRASAIAPIDTQLRVCESRVRGGSRVACVARRVRRTLGNSGRMTVAHCGDG